MFLKNSNNLHNQKRKERKNIIYLLFTRIRHINIQLMGLAIQRFNDDTKSFRKEYLSDQQI